MGPLAIIVAIELVITTNILGFSANPQAFNQTKNKISNVLGVRKLAQVIETPTPAPELAPTDTPPADTPTPEMTTRDTLVPSPVETPLPTPDATAPSSSDYPTPTPSNTSDLFGPDLNPIPTPLDQSLSNTNLNGQTPPQETTLSPNPIDSSGVTQTEAVLNPTELINSPDNISSQSIEEVKKEEDQLSKTINIGDQTRLLINFATDKVRDMSNFTKVDDFASTNFAASRFNSQMDQAITNLSKLPPAQQIPLKKQLINFCDQADQILRTVQLSVPEESEQDLEMARGQCQELQP